MVNSFTIVRSSTIATINSVGIKGRLVRNTTDVEWVAWISPDDTLVRHSILDLEFDIDEIILRHAFHGLCRK